MKPGTLVTYLSDPSLYGVMEVAFVDRGGRVHCRTLVDDAVETFEVHEIGIAEATVVH